MKYSAETIKNSTNLEPFYFDQLVDVSDLADSPNNDIREIGSVRVKGMCTVENDEFIFTFTISGEMILPCARTLIDVTYPFQIDATEIFTTSRHLNVEDKEEIHQVVEDTIDLTPFIYESILLQMPYRIFSNEKMIEDGEGWSFYVEDELKEKEAQQIDPRFAKLQQLMDEQSKKKK